jgi:DNA-directed RNA polymerase subunit RPC12/RpoP
METERVVCERCGTAFYVVKGTATVNCPTCGNTLVLYTPPPPVATEKLEGNSFDWGTFFWGALAGVVFGGLVFTALGRQILEGLGYRVAEKVKPKE